MSNFIFPDFIFTDFFYLIIAEFSGPNVLKFNYAMQALVFFISKIILNKLNIYIKNIYEVPERFENYFDCQLFCCVNELG